MSVPASPLLASHGMHRVGSCSGPTRRGPSTSGETPDAVRSGHYHEQADGSAIAYAAVYRGRGERGPHRSLHNQRRLSTNPWTTVWKEACDGVESCGKFGIF